MHTTARLLIACIDTFGFYLSLLLSLLVQYIFFTTADGFSLWEHFWVSAGNVFWVLGVFLGFIFYEELYAKRMPFWDEAKYLVKAVTLAFVMVLAIITTGNLKSDITNTTLIFLWLSLFFVLPVLRLYGKRWLHRLGIWNSRLLIIGTGTLARDTVKSLISDSFLGYEIVGFLSETKEKPASLDCCGRNYKVYGVIDDCVHYLKELDIRSIVIAAPDMPKERFVHWVTEAQHHVHRVMIAPDLHGIALLNSEIFHLFSEELFLIKIKNNLQSRTSQILKRIFDLVVSIIFFPLFLLVTGIIALLIKIDSRGPVFYIHQRVGKGGKPVGVIKFRSMYKDSKERLEKILATDPDAKEEWNTYYKLKNDPRITKVGAFLRKTSLDELPQVFNVLMGNMSLVGPRPVIQDEIDKYYKESARFYYMVTPGITGLWQTNGRSDTGYDFRVRIDEWYVLNWSLWLDIMTLCKTVQTVLKKQGAY